MISRNSYVTMDSQVTKKAIATYAIAFFAKYDSGNYLQPVS